MDVLPSYQRFSCSQDDYWVFPQMDDYSHNYSVFRLTYKKMNINLIFLENVGMEKHEGY